MERQVNSSLLTSMSKFMALVITSRFLTVLLPWKTRQLSQLGSKLNTVVMLPTEDSGKHRCQSNISVSGC